MRWRWIVAGLVWSVVCIEHAVAQIYNWQSSEVIPGTENIVPGPNLQLSGQQLDFARLSALNLTGSDFSGARLRSAQFDASQLVNVKMSNADLKSASFVGSNLTNANFTAADLSNAKFMAADLSNADLKGARFFEKFSLSVQYTFENSKLIGADLSGVDLSGISFKGTDFTNASLNGAIVRDTSFMFGSPTLAQLSTTLSYRFKDLTGIDLRDGIDFSNVDLSNFFLSDSRLDFANFTGTNLTGASIQGVSFLNATLTPQQLYSTHSYQAKNLRGVSISQDLANFSFEGQDLSNSIFTSVNLTGVNFTDAVISGMTFITPLTNEQLYSTKSYKNRDLRGIRFWSATQLKNVDFSGQDLTGSWIPQGASNVNLTDAIIRDASLFEKLTSNQIYSTKSYQEKDLRGVFFSAQNLQNLDFTNQDLRGASFEDSQLNQANFSQAKVTGVKFSRTNLTKEQLYATQSYQDRDLHGVHLPQLQEAWNLAGQDLRLAQLLDVKGSDLRGANLSSAYLSSSSDFNTALVDSTTTYDQWTLFAGDFDPVSAGMTRVETAAGDFNANGQFDVDDLKGLEDWLHLVYSQRSDTVVSWYSWLPKQVYDLNGDAEVDHADLEIWVHDLKKTTFGDANLDGQFDSGDLVEAFAAGEYEDTYSGNSHWETGDWNLDGDFDSTDLLLAFQDGGYELVAIAARPDNASSGLLAAVPEPGLGSLMTLGGFIMGLRRARRK